MFLCEHKIASCEVRNCPSVDNEVFFLFVFLRTPEGSSLQAQKEVHHDDGRDQEPVEEYRGALLELVSLVFTYQYPESF